MTMRTPALLAGMAGVWLRLDARRKVLRVMGHCRIDDRNPAKVGDELETAPLVGHGSPATADHTAAP